MSPFANRKTAGRELAELVHQHCNKIKADHLLVLGLPRGGVPVAAEIASRLGAELDVMLVRKLGLPWHPELAMGAIASDGVRILNDNVMQNSQVTELDLAAVEKRERIELQRREKAYRGGRPHPRIKDRTVILVDDGIATGATMFAAVEAVRLQAPAAIIVAAPVAAADTIERLQCVADQVICVLVPESLYAIGAWYKDFSQTTDAEVCDLLAQAANYFVP